MPPRYVVAKLPSPTPTDTSRAFGSKRPEVVDDPSIKSKEVYNDVVLTRDGESKQPALPYEYAFDNRKRGVTNRALLEKRPFGHVSIAKKAQYNTNLALIGIKVGFVVLGWNSATQQVVEDKDQATHITRVPVRSAGVVSIGGQGHALCVAEGTRILLLMRGKQLWIVPHIRLDESAPNLTRVPYQPAKEYAEALQAVFVERYKDAQPAAALSALPLRYWRCARRYALGACEEAATRGQPLDLRALAKATNCTWTLHDLVQPWHPTILNATYLALACCLEAGKGAVLIQEASMIEWGALQMGDAEAMELYQRAVQLLSRVVPDWAAFHLAFRWEKQQKRPGAEAACCVTHAMEAHAKVVHTLMAQDYARKFSKTTQAAAPPILTAESIDNK